MNKNRFVNDINMLNEGFRYNQIIFSLFSSLKTRLPLLSHTYISANINISYQYASSHYITPKVYREHTIKPPKTTLFTRQDETFPWETLNEYPKLWRVHLHHNLFTSFPQLVSDALEDINLWQNPITTFTRESFEGAPNLRIINVTKEMMVYLFSPLMICKLDQY